MRKASHCGSKQQQSSHDVIGSLCYCLFAPHIYIVVLSAHPIRGESHNQRNANVEVATILRRTDVFISVERMGDVCNPNAVQK